MPLYSLSIEILRVNSRYWIKQETGLSPFPLKQPYLHWGCLRNNLFIEDANLSELSVIAGGDRDLPAPHALEGRRDKLSAGLRKCIAVHVEQVAELRRG